MSNINLLPWREEQQRYKKAIFFIALLMTSLLVLLICYLGKVFIDFKIESQVKRNQFLQTEINLLNKKIVATERIKAQKDELDRRIQLIRNLEKKRSAATQLFNILPQITPDGVYLTTVNFSNEHIKITGLTESNEQISQLVRNIEKTTWLSDVSLPSIVAAPANSLGLSKFSMNFFMLSN